MSKMIVTVEIVYPASAGLSDDDARKQFEGMFGMMVDSLNRMGPEYSGKLNFRWE
jgi:hypothetical protein